jgi:cytochrome c556
MKTPVTDQTSGRQPKKQRGEFMIIRIALAAIVAASAATAVVAQGDAIAQRKALMKGNSEQGRIARAMIDGKQPYSNEVAQKIFANFQDAAAKLPGLFPENSKTGDTRALPVIWEKKAEFDAAAAKFGADAKAAAAKAKDLDSFKASMSEVGRNCGTCHDAWRKKG